MKAVNRVSAAYEQSEPARQALLKMNAQGIEITEDKTGIVWQRWLVPVGDQRKVTSVILFCTPDWWDIFAPVTEDTTIEGTIEALRALK